MSGTQKPTAARQRDFRKRGDLARSRDAVAAATLAGAAAALLLTASTSWAAIAELAARACRGADSVDGLGEVAGAALAVSVQVAAPVLLGAVAGALLSIGWQLGWPPAFHVPWRRDSQRSTISQLRQAFGLAAMARRTAVTVLKLAAIGLTVALALQPQHPLPVSSVPQLLTGVARCCTSALVASALVFLGLGLGDYLFARWRLAGRMKMTPEELRREHREHEGDPAVAARRASHRGQLGKRRLKGAIAGADAVVLSAGEAAIALRYRAATDSAPQVVAKGRGAQADKLAALARARGVLVLTRPALARALAEVPDRNEIPSQLYGAVAEVLAQLRQPQQPHQPGRGRRELP